MPAGACHRAALRADPVAGMTSERYDTVVLTRPTTFYEFDSPVALKCRVTSACAVGQISTIVPRILSRHEGRIAIVTNVGQVAVDVEVSKTNETDADGEVVWSWHTLAGAKLATMLMHCADDGGKRWLTGESAK